MNLPTVWKIAVPLLALAAGCGPSPVLPLSQDARAQLRGTVRIHAVQVDKRIHMVEQLYRGIWTEMRFNSFATEGDWDPGPAMEKRLLAILGNRVGIEGTLLRHELDDAAFASFQKNVVEEIARGLREVGGTALVHPVGGPYASLKSRGIEYVLELILDDVTFAPTWAVDRLSIQVTGRLVRIADGTVLWAEQGWSSPTVSGVDYFSDLTKGDFALLRERFDEAMKYLLSTDNPFLEGLAQPGR